MKLLHVKLKNGEDLLSEGLITTEGVTLNNPIAFSIDPDYGIFAKAWLILSETKTVMIPREEILLSGVASDKAVKYYNEYVERLSDASDKPLEDNPLDELEELFTSMIESKGYIKH